jgi:putative transcriptional regulator
MARWPGISFNTSMTLNPDYPSIAGQLLVASPAIGDLRFRHSVIFMAAHDHTGAMGIVINAQKIGTMLSKIFEDMDIAYSSADMKHIPVMNGGPAEPGRGFILHDTGYIRATTVIVNDDFAVTGTLDQGDQPQQMLFATGYAAWTAGQLEQELVTSAWLVMPATLQLVFHTPPDLKWGLAMNDAGINPGQFMGVVGHA